MRRASYRYPLKVEELLARSFPVPGGADEFRRAVDAGVGIDRLGIAAPRDGGLGFSFPVAIVSALR